LPRAQCKQLLNMLSSRCLLLHNRRCYPLRPNSHRCRWVGAHCQICRREILMSVRIISIMQLATVCLWGILLVIHSGNLSNDLLHLMMSCQPTLITLIRWVKPPVPANPVSHSVSCDFISRRITLSVTHFHHIQSFFVGFSLFIIYQSDHYF